ncbi:MAG: hypothetical protein Rubg2KO_16150 [Rubricoccaceae bacterium]
MFPRPLHELATEVLASSLRLGAEVPLERSDEVKATVRDLFRHRGYKPTGRGKPASEYLVGAATAERLGSINVAVDACNVVSLHSGLPISVVDLGRATAPFRIDVPEDGAEYVFNASAQSIRLTGLLCLFDADGPCANAVRDSQRIKTQDDTRRTLSVVWAPESLATHRDAAVGWYRHLLASMGATTETVELAT